MADRNQEQERFQRAIQIFQQVVERDAKDRPRIVHRLVEGDEDLEREVLALLEAHESDASLPAIRAQAVPPERSQNVLEQIGPYRVLHKIGEGGMGTVFLAEQHEPIRRQVALKLLKPGLGSTDVVSRFEAERQALALMDHPHIAKVFDGGVTEDGRPFFAMEHVSGEPLTTFCDRQRLSLQERLELFVKVCDAIQHAHQKGVIHRDLKPSNVIVTTSDGVASPKVIDFGVAKAVGARLTPETLYTAHGLLIGTPEYMSPEQADAGVADIDTRSDVYSLGVMLYEVLVGYLPFDREVLRKVGLTEAIRILREEEPPRPSTRLSSLGADARQSVARERRSSESQIRRELGRDLDWVVLKALEKDRKRRYASVSEIAADIGRYLRNEPVVAGSPSVTYRVSKFVRRHRLGVLSATVLSIVLVGSAVALSFQARQLRVALDEATQQRDRAETVSDLLVDAFGEADPTRRTVDRDVTAREVLERAAESLEERRLPGDVHAALSSSMASAFLGLNDVQRAEQLTDTTLAAAEQIGGEPLASILIMKSRVLRAQSKVDQAAEYSKRAVTHADAASLSARTRVRARQALGADLRRAAKHADADAVLVEAEALASSNPDVDPMLGARILLERAEIARQLANYQQSIELGQRALEKLTALSTNPLHWIQARRAIAISLYELGRMQEALEWNSESYGIALQRLGTEHPTTRLLRDNYATLMHLSGNGKQALPLLEEAVAISREIDPDGATICSELNNLGQIQQGLDRLGDAEATFREALRKQLALVGDNHPNPGFHMMNLARVLQDAGRYSEAEQYYQDALELWERLLPAGHTLVGNVKVWYGALMVETGRAAEGRPFIEAGVGIRSGDRGSDDWQTAEAKSWLGTALAELGESEQAEELLVQAYPVVFKQRGPDWRRTRWALRRILGYYDLVGDQAGFERYAAEYQSTTVS